MSNEMQGIIDDPKNFSVPAVENPYEDDFGLFTSALFLPRLSMEGSSSKLVKKKKVSAGNYIVITGREEFQDLGNSLDLLVLTYRSKALDLSDLKNITASFDPKSDEFKRIQGESQNKSKGYLYGLEFLVWVPSMEGDQKFATFFMGNPTARVAAKNFKPLLKSATNPRANNQATLTTELIDNQTHQWEAPVILPCSGDLPNYPTVEQMSAQMSVFLNPPKTPVKEEVPDEVAGGNDRG